MRAPCVPVTQWAVECALDRIGRTLGMTTEDVRLRNFYAAGNLTPFGQAIPTPFALPTVWSTLRSSSDYDQRLASVRDIAGRPASPRGSLFPSQRRTLGSQVRAFNADNRWRKRGIVMQATKYVARCGGRWAAA